MRVQCGGSSCVNDHGSWTRFYLNMDDCSEPSSAGWYYDMTILTHYCVKISPSLSIYYGCSNSLNIFDFAKYESQDCTGVSIHDEQYFGHQCVSWNPGMNFKVEYNIFYNLVYLFNSKW